MKTAEEEKKVEVGISVSYKELKKAIKSVPLCDIDEIIDIDDIIDGFSTSEILSHIDEDEIADYALQEDLISDNDVLETIPIHDLISYVKGETGEDDFSDETVESVEDFIKILKKLVKRFNNTVVFTKEDLKKGVCELIDAYCI